MGKSGKNKDPESSKTATSSSSSSKKKTLGSKEEKEGGKLKVDASAIDDLFADIPDIKAAKRQQEEDEIAAETAEEEDYGPPLVPHTGKMSSDKFVRHGLVKPENGEVMISPEAPLERMQDGVAVYKAHLLKVGGGGGTELCPFDCNCCF